MAAGTFVVQVCHTVNDLVDEVGCIPLRVVALCCHSTDEKGKIYCAAWVMCRLLADASSSVRGPTCPAALHLTQAL